MDHRLTPATRLLRLVEHGTGKVARATISRDAAIREAHRAGARPFDIAAAANLDVEAIRQIINRRRS